jgi:hypothetical protein
MSFETVWPEDLSANGLTSTRAIKPTGLLKKWEWVFVLAVG